MIRNVNRVDHVAGLVRPENYEATIKRFAELFDTEFYGPTDRPEQGMRVAVSLDSGIELITPLDDNPENPFNRMLDALSDERGYQILDYIEFLDSKYAERARPGGILAKITETVEDTMRAGKLPIQAISGTMGIMDSAAKVMKGLAAAGQAVVDEAVKAAETAAAPEPPAKPADLPTPDSSTGS